MAAGLSQAILEFWDQSEPLTTAVPTERVSHEIRQTNEDIADDDDESEMFDTCVTYEVVTDVLWRTNSGVGYRSDVTLTCYSESADEAQQVGRAISAAFERQSFIGSECVVTLIRLAGGMELEQDEETGLWQASVPFTMNHTTV